MPRPGASFRPRFTLVLLYVLAFFLLYAMAFALPELIAGARQLPAGQGALTPEEMAQAGEIGRNALGGGKLLIALVASLLTVGFALWRRILPGVH